MNSRLVPVIWTGKEKELTIRKFLTKRGDKLTVLLLLAGKKDDTVHITVNIRHRAPDTASRVIVKGILTGRSKINFDGLVKIDRGAVNATAWLEARLLLLSDHASGRIVPKLEISENEVRAGHAAAIGKISEEDIFYLMTRGVPRKTATALIARGFLESLLSEFPVKFAGAAGKLFI